MAIGLTQTAPSVWQREIPGLRLLAIIMNALLAILMMPALAWLTVYLVAGFGSSQLIMVRSGLLFISLLLVATALCNALFLMRPPEAARSIAGALKVFNIVSLAILLSIALPVWLTQVDAELIDSVMSSARRARRVMRVAVLTFSPLIIIGLGFTQIMRRIRNAA
jgi:hypothetical protein